MKKYKVITSFIDFELGEKLSGSLIELTEEKALQLDGFVVAVEEPKDVLSKPKPKKNDDIQVD
ncbi:MAG: hypothetical protein QXT97_02540 [Candidatus Diapherotrites archaeon]